MVLNSSTDCDIIAEIKCLRTTYTWLFINERTRADQACTGSLHVTGNQANTYVHVSSPDLRLSNTPYLNIGKSDSVNTQFTFYQLTYLNCPASDSTCARSLSVPNARVWLSQLPGTNH